MSNDAPPAFFCPISMELMRDPVSTVDGHCYERAAIERWFEGSRTSPKTGARLSSTTVIPSHSLRQAIEEWEEAHCKLLQRSSLTPVQSTPPHTPAETFNRA
eukprot:gene28292-biopygen23581